MQRETDQTVLKAIEDNNMIFVSAQPDTPYFHWQVEIYLYQFSKHGILNRCYALFGYKGSSPSAYARQLAKKYPNIKFYRDDRTSDEYSPTIRPHILAKFFKEYPQLGYNVFYHDSDIFLIKLPRFDLMLLPYDSNAYLSDTVSYIGYEYIKNCSNRYKLKHPKLKDLDIFYGMCEAVDIDPALVQKNQNNSGGAQYLLKNIDYTFWEKCEKACVKLYSYLTVYEKTYPVSDHIQKWTTDMWVVLWIYWRDIGNTLIHKDLDFSWATGTVKDYNTFNIFHLAGVTNKNSSDKFQKGNYTKQVVFDAYYKNPKLFDFINKDSATYEYVKVIKEYVRDVYMPERRLVNNAITNAITNGQDNTSDTVNTVNKINKANAMSNVKVMNYKDFRSFDQVHQQGIQNKEKQNQGQIQAVKVKPEQTVQNRDGQHSSAMVRRFKMITSNICNGIYSIDSKKQCCGKNVWRSEDGVYIIFWTGKHWIITYSKYEKQIGPTCGGIIATASEFPYLSNWNISDLKIDIL